MTLLIRELQYEREFEPLFSPISLQMNKGETLLVQGPNGSGKSTLLRLIAGLLNPTNGSLYWEDELIHNNLSTYQQRINYIGHLPGIQKNLSVQENICFQASLVATSVTQNTITAILKKIGLTQEKNKLAKYLSAGQLRRLSFAKLLLDRSQIWILDEPTTALDLEGQKILLNLLELHTDEQGIAIISSHQTLPITKTLRVLHLGEP